MSFQTVRGEVATEFNGTAMSEIYLEGTTGQVVTSRRNIYFIVTYIVQMIVIRVMIIIWKCYEQTLVWEGENRFKVVIAQFADVKRQQEAGRRRLLRPTVNQISIHL